MASSSSSSSSSSSPMKYHVFLSFRGEDTRLNFTAHLREALEKIGMSVFFDEEKLERGEELSPALSQAIASSRLSIIVLSSDYVSSKSCLDELSDIMDRKSSQGQIVLPIFYHVDPSHVQNIGGSFKESFEERESKRPMHEVKRWKAAFAQVSELKLWHIKGDKLDRPETEHIKNIVDYVTQKLMKHQVFLSFRDEGTDLNFTAHLLKALEDKGINVFSNKGDQFSQAVAVSNLSIIIFSVDYASSKSCLAELSDIMNRKDNLGQTVIPVFYHVDPSHVRNLGGSFKASFDDHESKGLQQVQQWKMAFTKAGTLKGWHIEGGRFDRADTEYIEDVVEYVIKKLNSKSRSVYEELVGIDDQKKEILRLIEKEESRVIGLLGMGGIGKTTLAESVYNEISPEFESRCFLRNVRQEIKDKGMESVRNKLLSKLLDDKIDVGTLTIDSFTRDRLNSIRVIIVLDDVDDAEQINLMGVKYFGDGSKIIATSRDRQVLKNGGAEINIHDVKGLNKTDSLQLFSTFAFKLLNPAVDFRYLSSGFVEYAKGSPLALKVLGSKLYTKSIKEWESEVDRLKQYAEPKISKILESSFDGLDELGRKIFLDIACFFKGQSEEVVKEILSCTYKGAASGISNLLDKCLLDITAYGQISMHDMLEEMGKDIVCQESKSTGERSRLWIPKDVYQVLKYNKGTELIEGIKLDMSQIDNLQLCPSIFKNMINLTYIHFYFTLSPKLLADGIDIDYLSNELRCLWWEFYPFKSLPPSFNPKNLVVLRLCGGNMEQLWNEDDHTDLVNLRVLDVSNSKNLRKISNLLGAINLKTFNCGWCQSLVELPCLNHLTSLATLGLFGCGNLRKIPDLLGAINLKILNCSHCTSLVELPCLSHLTSLETLDLSGCKNLKRIPDLLEAINLKWINCRSCTGLVEFSCLNRYPSLKTLDLSGCNSLKRIPNLLWAINLKRINCSDCTSLVELPCLSHLTSLENLHLSNCKNLKRIPDLLEAINLKRIDCRSCTGLVELPCLSHLTSLENLDLSNCKNLKRIPHLLETINLKRINCSWCTGLVEFSCLNRCSSLETLDLPGCNRLKRIPNLLGAINLKRINCRGCTSLVELPCLSHLTFLEDLVLAGCPVVKKFPELPNSFFALDISFTEIEEVPDSIEHLLRLKSLNLRKSKVKNISSNISKLESLQRLDVANCQGLKSLPELPPYLCRLEADGCTSLERVEFTNHNLYESDSIGDERVFLSFSNCWGLNQDSIENIETNAMLEIQYLAQRLARDVIYHRKSRFDGFICLFPENEISANEFEHRGTESRLNLKIAPNGRSGSRFLAFAICLVTDYTDIVNLNFNCKFLLTAASGEEFRSQSVFSKVCSSYKPRHVFILFGEDMIVKDNDYEEASFDLYMIDCWLKRYCKTTTLALTG